MRRLNNVIFATLLILLAVMPMAAQGLPGFTLGYSPSAANAYNLSVGNANVAAPEMTGAMLLNPAGLESNRLSASIDFGGFRMEEKRAFPVYDRFDGVVTKGTYVVNSQSYGDLYLYVRTGMLASSFKRLTLGIFSAPWLQNRYDYLEYVRDNVFGDPVIGYNKIEGKGNLRLTGLNMAFLPVSRVQVGINVGRISESESARLLVMTHYEDETQTDIVSETVRKLDNNPYYFQLGSVVKLDTRWSAAFQMKLPVSLEYKTSSPRRPFALTGWADTVMTEKMERPLELGAGFVYRARTPFKTRLFMNYTYRFWSAVTHEIGDKSYKNLNDTWEIATALEFTYLHENTFTFSYSYANNPWDKSETVSRFGLGIGVPVPNATLHLAGGFARKFYREYDLFDDALFGGDRANSTIDEVTENYFYGMVGLNIYLK